MDVITDDSKTDSVQNSQIIDEMNDNQNVTVQSCDVTTLVGYYINQFQVISKHYKTFYLNVGVNQSIRFKIYAKRSYKDTKCELVGQQEFKAYDFIEDERYLFHFNLASYSLVKAEIKCVESIYRNIDKKILPIVDNPSFPSVVCCLFLQNCPFYRRLADRLTGPVKIETDTGIEIVNDDPENYSDNIILIHLQTDFQQRFYFLMENGIIDHNSLNESFYSRIPMKILSKKNKECKIKFVVCNRERLIQQLEDMRKEVPQLQSNRKVPSTAGRLRASQRNVKKAKTINTEKSSETEDELKKLQELDEEKFNDLIKKNSEVMIKSTMIFPPFISVNNFDVLHVATGYEYETFVVSVQKDRSISKEYVDAVGDIKMDISQKLYHQQSSEKLTSRFSYNN